LTGFEIGGSVLRVVRITLIDGSIREYENGITIMRVAESISSGLARVVLAGEVDGQLKDLRFKLENNCRLKLLKFEDEGGKLAYRHTTAHILAQAVKHLFPEVKLTIGPAIDEGFYYDFDTNTPFSIEDLEKIEEEIKKLIKEDIKLERFALPRDKALKFIEEMNEPYKIELLNDIPEDEEISFYRQGDFTDLCAGPHIPSTGLIKAFKERGIRIPDDVAVVGYDNLPVGKTITPVLTTIAVDRERMGMLAARRAFELAQGTFTGARFEKTALFPELIIRESCGAKRRIVHK